MKPFRWDIAKREQLGRLVDAGVFAATRSDAYPEFVSDLRQCVARIVAFAGDSELVFIGRSPESIFDYLSGVFFDTPWYERLKLANISIRYESLDLLQPAALLSAKEHFRAIGLAPLDIVHNSRPIALVDLVSSGSTFQNTSQLLLSWAREEVADLPAVRRKLRFVGVTWKTKNSPKTFRWQQHASWLSEFPSGCVKNVSAPGRLWDYLGNYQPKVGWSNPPQRWTDPKITEPPHRDSNIAALKLALEVFDTARTSEEREAFSDCLRNQPQMSEAWFRQIVSQVRN
ncbi:MAG: hypothetical protein AAF483_04390 [Planctomycetota bacterium]